MFSGKSQDLGIVEERKYFSDFVDNFIVSTFLKFGIRLLSIVSSLTKFSEQGLQNTTVYGRFLVIMLYVYTTIRVFA
jgi:hypothetical protein